MSIGPVAEADEPSARAVMAVREQISESEKTKPPQGGIRFGARVRGAGGVRLGVVDIGVVGTGVRYTVAMSTRYGFPGALAGHLRGCLVGLLVGTVAHAAAPPVDASGPQDEAVIRQMVVTVDDLPASRARGIPEARLVRLNEALIEVLRSESIPAIGFVNEEKLEIEGVVSADRVQLLEAWLKVGLELGNHTYSHPSLHDMARADYQRDILLGERITRPLAARYELPYRFFRHPFLRTGLDLETKRGVEAFLAEHAYRVAPVTIDNSEWIFARAYDEALDRDDPALAVRLGQAYVDYMEAMTAYYEEQARRIFDREIPQVVLIHANALNADYLATLVERWRERGYRFVDLESALDDPAYASEDTYIGRGGITWLHRWAITRGVDGSVFRGEPATPEWIQEVAGIRE